MAFTILNEVGLVHRYPSFVRQSHLVGWHSACTLSWHHVSYFVHVDVLHPVLRRNFLLQHVTPSTCCVCFVLCARSLSLSLSLSLSVCVCVCVCFLCGVVVCMCTDKAF